MADGVDHIDIYADVGEEFNQVQMYTVGAECRLLPWTGLKLISPPRAHAPAPGGLASYFHQLETAQLPDEMADSKYW